MAMTLLEKILAAHSGNDLVKPGQIVDIEIDARVARDFGGANVVKNMQDFGLSVNDPDKTLFTFDCNPTGSDQSYAVNQHKCRIFARENGVKVFDIDSGIGTHILIDNGYAWPGSTAVSTDSHANILGAIGSFGQGMGDMDIASAWHKGKAWFKVPPSVCINLIGTLRNDVSAKDIILNLLGEYGANSLLGYSVEFVGSVVENLSIDDRITISSMATEMGAIIILFPPNNEITEYCRKKTTASFIPVYADRDAQYEKIYTTDVSEFRPMVSLPGEPHNTVSINKVKGIKIDSAFIGSCTNGRMSDMRSAASILKNKKVAPGVVLKIVPATDEIWKQCLMEGLIDIFKDSGALVSNAGCAGCAAGQVGQNGAGEITVSTGNRNFPGKQGKGSVYLASPAVVAASALSGYITTPDEIPDIPAVFSHGNNGKALSVSRKKYVSSQKSSVLEGRVWLIPGDNIDTDMIYHNKHLAITETKEMGKYAFGNLKGFEDFSSKALPGDIIVTGKNFGSGSSRQQAVDCFIALETGAILAESFGAIYERNAVNAAFPLLVYKPEDLKNMKTGDIIRIDLKSGKIVNITTGIEFSAEPFSDVQYEIYMRGGLLG
jgi:homoaconitate hydratase family protein/3-isopropylmalate dehydratase small subunit